MKNRHYFFIFLVVLILLGTTLFGLKNYSSFDGLVAEREGFEPSKQFPVYTLSKRAPSATRPPLQLII